eukprot:1158152-Pelagomonas_calceolata.AAC.7
MNGKKGVLPGTSFHHPYIRPNSLRSKIGISDNSRVIALTLPPQFSVKLKKQNVFVNEAA